MSLKDIIFKFSGVILYLISIVFILIVFAPFLISSFRFLNIDNDSARYMLSALVQSEAAILAIVVSLSLIAVQHAASSYSTRIIDVFKSKNSGLWILTGIYILAIIYGLGVILLIDSTDHINNKENFKNYIKLAYYFGILAFLSLVPYIWSILNLLKPSTVINMLTERITKQSILSAIEEGQEKPDDKDPIQPIIDIVRSSLMKYDYETVRDGLRAIGYRTNQIFKNETLNEAEGVIISEHLFTHFTRVGKLAARRRDDDSTSEVIANLQKTGIIMAEQRLGYAVIHVAFSLGEVGKVAAEQKLWEATWQTALSLREIGKVTAEQILDENSSQMADSLEKAMWQIADSLEKVGISSAKKKLEKATLKTVDSLEKVGISVAKQKLEYSTMKVIEALEKVGIVAAENKFGDVTVKSSKALLEVGSVATEQMLIFDVFITKIKATFEKIINVLDKQELEEAKIEVEDYLENYIEKVDEKNSV